MPGAALQAAAQVVIDGLVKQYGALRALGGVSFNIAAGEWVALMGPSGSGKTTLINVLGGLDTLTSGRVVVDGVDLARLNENAMVRYRAEKIGFVFQQFHLVPYLNAVENVMLAQFSLRDRRKPGRRSAEARRPRRTTDTFAVATFRRRTATVAIARVINEPKLIWPMSRPAISMKPTNRSDRSVP
jgi:ABC-type lipoprotein export system ATPase subunit